MSPAIKRALTFLVGLLALEAVTAAQCPQPDLLDCGPCCTVAHPKVQGFPNFTQDSLEICWQDCNIAAVIGCQAVWSNVPILPFPGGGACEPRTATLKLLGGGVLKWEGKMRLLYSRTWLETDSAGLGLQVWRFLVNGDLRPQGPIAIPCPVPPCAPAHGNRVRFTGYLDYAKTCTTGTLELAWMLTHSCDAIDHHAGFPRAGAFHPDRAYTFVGPAAGFAPAAVLPIEGTPGSPLEDVRRLNLPPAGAAGPTTCDYEEAIQYTLSPLQQLCLCGTSPTPQYSIASLLLLGVCGTSISTPGGPFLPGFISMGIGSWTDPTKYPGLESLRWNAGGYDYFDPCTGVTRREVFFGVTTLRGYPAIQLLCPGPAAALPPTFIDQSNSLTTTGATIMNVPYVSDHILNLNHP